MITSQRETPLLEVRDLRKEFHGRGFRAQSVLAVDGISFSLAAGETLGIVGESGSGKSTTGYCVLRLIEPTSGSVTFMGTEVTQASAGDLRRLRREMQIVFQDPYASLDPRHTIEEIIRQPLDIHGIGTADERRRRVRGLLEVVGIDPRRMDSYPREFSGGQRQRVGIARAIALKPKLLVCDEPVSALDISIQAQILNLLKDIQDEFKLSYLFITHDLAVSRSMSDRIAVMAGGKIVETGDAETIYQTPQVEYTRRLLAAVPVPDVARIRERAERRGVSPAAGRQSVRGAPNSQFRRNT